mmetsp:Transcript_115712/g.327953  ORF Transcript_115712/g.327953 Transcript_115712/m.327953 type:complete len:202 (-) Transcript_115712:554-1159(-)
MACSAPHVGGPRPGTQDPTRGLPQLPSPRDGDNNGARGLERRGDPRGGRLQLWVRVLQAPVRQEPLQPEDEGPEDELHQGCAGLLEEAAVCVLVSDLQHPVCRGRPAVLQHAEARADLPAHGGAVPRVELRQEAPGARRGWQDVQGPLVRGSLPPAVEDARPERPLHERRDGHRPEVADQPAGQGPAAVQHPRLQRQHRVR